MDARNNIKRQLSAKARLKRKNILIEQKNTIKNATKCSKQQKMKSIPLLETTLNFLNQQSDGIINLDRSPTENASQETKT